jgi:phosphoribosyl-AMP cyclohydrolase
MRKRALLRLAAEQLKGRSLAMTEAVKLDFAKMDGLLPAIVQDAVSGEVLMVGFLNDTSYAKTLETGFVTFWSRTRQKLWMKGETSGNRLRVVSAATDCDQDTVLFRVIVEGDGLVCHEGTVSCFTNTIELPVAVKTEARNGSK